MLGYQLLAEANLGGDVGDAGLALGVRLAFGGLSRPLLVVSPPFKNQHLSVLARAWPNQVCQHAIGWDRPAPTLTDFFRDYLQVARERSDQELTSDVKDVVRIALQDNREFLPKGGVAACVSRANGVLRAVQEINETVIRQAVWVGAGQPADDETKARFDNSVDRLVRKKKLAGLAFAPAPAVLPRSVKRTVTTQEGVRLEYNTALEGQSVVEETLPDGRTRFVVTTEGYTDDVNSDRTRRAA